MKLTLTRSLIAAAILVSASVVAQTGGAPSAALPAAPGAATDPPALGAGGTGSKIGAINVEQAIFASNEGQRDFEALSKRLEPKQNDLKGKNDEIEGLKKQLNTQGDKLNDETKGNLTRQIEQKQKALERAAQDAQEDARNQENEIAQRILQKMAPLIVKYAGENSFGVIIDTSNPWPNGPVLWAGPAVDITRPIVDSYNVQSGVPAPPKPAAGARPTTPGTKPLTAPGAPITPTPKPRGTQPPK